MKTYKDYKTFNIKLFKRDLGESLENHTTYDSSCFQNIFIALRNKHAPMNKKIMRFNNNPFRLKALRQTIVHRSKVKNIYNKYRTEDNWANYKKQINFCVNLLRKTKGPGTRIHFFEIFSKFKYFGNILSMLHEE